MITKLSAINEIIESNFVNPENEEFESINFAKGEIQTGAFRTSNKNILTVGIRNIFKIEFTITASFKLITDYLLTFDCHGIKPVINDFIGVFEDSAIFFQDTLHEQKIKYNISTVPINEQPVIIEKTIIEGVLQAIDKLFP